MWKKVLVVMLIVVIFLGVTQLKGIDVPTVGTEQSTPQSRWLLVGSFVSAGSDPVDLIDTERLYLTVVDLIETAADDEEKIILKQLKYGVNGLRFRLVGLTENGVVVLQLYSGALGVNPNCELVKRGTLTFTIGTQTSIHPGLELADTVVVSNDRATTKNWAIASPANNTCAEVYIDIQGDDVLCVVPTIIPSNCSLFMKDM